MRLYERVRGIARALNSTDEYLTARQICNTLKNPDDVTQSDCTSVQSILNVMICMDYVKPKDISTTESPRYAYAKVKRINLYDGIA